MALMYTELSGSETQGEKAFYYKFKNKLSDEYIIWHNYIIQEKSKEIDFIIFHPVFGIWVIEIKDWTIDQIKEVSLNGFEIEKNGKRILYKNPLTQARKNWAILKEKFELNKSLLHNDGIHKGKLILPINYGVGFYNLYQSDIKNHNLSQYLPLNKIITAELLKDEAVTEEEWERKLNEMRDVAFNFELSLEQINLIKTILGTSVVFDPINKINIGTLDDYQEKLVKFKIDKQILIEGPAGSGKSLVLLKRAIYIKNQHPDWEVAIICYNALMGNYLRLLSNIEGYDKKIDIYDIYDWVKKYIPEINNLWHNVYDPEEAISVAINNNYLINKKYDALLIDEGQDTTSILIKLYRQMLKEESNSFTFCFDKRQSIYTTGEIIDKLNEYGFKIERERELVKQQRSIIVILALAFYKKMLDPNIDYNNLIQELNRLVERMFYGIKQKFISLMTGIQRFFKSTKTDNINIKEELINSIILVQTDDYETMIANLIKVINEDIEGENSTYTDWLVIYPTKIIKEVSILNLIINNFEKHNIPFEEIAKNRQRIFTENNNINVIIKGDNRRDVNLVADVVKIMTIHSSKGLDAKNVAILCFDAIDETFKDKSAEIGYVALTRAKSKCYIYYQKESPSVKILMETYKQLISKL